MLFSNPLAYLLSCHVTPPLAHGRLLPTARLNSRRTAYWPLGAGVCILVHRGRRITAKYSNRGTHLLPYVAIDTLRRPILATYYWWRWGHRRSGPVVLLARPLVPINLIKV